MYIYTCIMHNSNDKGNIPREELEIIFITQYSHYPEYGIMLLESGAENVIGLIVNIYYKL